MIKHINPSNLKHGRVITYHPDDQLLWHYSNNLKGFGVHFAPFKQHDSFKLRVENSAVGLTTYAPNQIFSVDDIEYELISEGNETISIQPSTYGNQLQIIPEKTGTLQLAYKNSTAYKAPSWAYGYWFSTPWTKMNWCSVENEVSTAIRLDLKPRVWLLDAGWQSSQKYLKFHEDRFGTHNPLNALTQLDIKPILWIAPWIQYHEPLWNFFDTNNWFVKDKNGNSYKFSTTGDGTFLGSYFDITNKEFINFWTKSLNDLTEQGAAGYMFDFGEALPDDAVFALETPGSIKASADGIIGHNWYVLESKRLLHQIINNKDIVIYSRSGWADSCRYGGLWLGDQSSDGSRFAGLGSVLWGYKTALEAGYRFIGMDVGGYFGKSTINDYLDWLDFSVLMPFNMLHGMQQSNPWEEGKRAIEKYKTASQIHKHIWNQHNKPLPKFSLINNSQTISKIAINDYEYSPTKSS